MKTRTMNEENKTLITNGKKKKKETDHFQHRNANRYSNYIPTFPKYPKPKLEPFSCKIKKI